MADANTTAQSVPTQATGSETANTTTTAQNNNIIQNIDTASTDTQVTATASEAANRSFLESLPETLRGEKSLASFKDPSELAKSYVEAQKLIGKKVSQMTPEEIKQFNKNLGVPESKDNYDFGEDTSNDPNMVNWFKGAAHEAGITQDAAKKLVEKWNGQVAESKKMVESQIELKNEENVKFLKSEFGAAFDEKVNHANKAISKFGGEPLVKVLSDYGLQSNPVLVKAFAEAGKLISEGSLPNPTSNGQYGLTPAEARAKIEQTKADPSFQKRMRSNDIPTREEAFKELENLYKLSNHVKGK